jgi:glycosyltransferase involved in cell wall biosynthesis
VNADHLAALAPEPGCVELLYHGMDFTRFPRPAERRARRDGRDPDDPVIVLSVGRAVAKKGYAVLLEALSELPPELAWRLVHIGGGPLLDELKRRAQSLAVSDRISWLGARSQQDVVQAYRAADLFVLACRIAEDGDRDGLPNVLMEAQSQGLSCISTTVSAIAELIDDGETGLLVPPDDPAALARAIERLIRFPDLRVLLGSAGLRRVRNRFSFERGIDRLARRFGVEAGAHETCESRSMRR